MLADGKPVRVRGAMKTKNYWPVAFQAVAIAIILAAGLGSPFAKGVTKRMRFPRGSNSTVVEGAVIRGDRDRYMLAARAGQTMTVSITSLEDNAVFQIYQPGAKKTLEGAGEAQDATRWSGRLPATGDYTIFVGGTRGNASYKLSVKVE
jgi:hypothetical protein